MPMWCAGVVLCSLALAGCGASTDGSGPAPASLRIVQSDSPTPSGMEAALRGTMIVDANGCVQARTPTNTLVTLVWPRGYSVLGESKSFEVLDGDKNVVARSGATLAIGGGGADAFQDAWTERACAGGGNLWMVGNVHTARAASLGTPIVVATSSWKPGDGGDLALLTGTLRATSEGCPYVDASMNPAHPSPVAVVWPAGYQARREPGGGIEVTGPDGSVVIREGDRFRAGGGYSESKGLPCTLGAAGAFGIQSSISRERPSR